MRTVIYARFSSDNQNPRSTADQIDMCRKRAEQEGWTVVATFEDTAISGAAGIDAHQRPGLAAMLALVEAGGVDQVLAESTDRISRHVADAHTIRERIEFVGARLFTLFDGTVTPMVGLVKGFMDAQFRTDLAKRVRRGHVGALKSGRIPGSIAYGHRQANRLDEKGKAIRGLREIDEERAAIVRRIFREFAAGRSTRAIVKDLNAENVPGPRGGIWHETALNGGVRLRTGMLRNETYRGLISYGWSRSVVNPKTRQRGNRPTDGEAVESKHMAHLQIIDDETWQRVQDRLAENSGRAPERCRRPKHVLSGLGVCGICGAPWVKQSSTFWGCSRRTYGHACTNNRLINTRRYEGAVMAELKAGLLAPDVVTAYVREYHREFASKSVELGRQREKLERALGEVNRRKERLLKAVMDGGSEFAEIRAMLAEARDEAARLEREMASLDATPTVLALHPHIEETYRRQVEELDEALAQPEAQLEAVPRVRALIARVIVRPNPDKQRGCIVEVVRQMDEILSMATGDRKAVLR